MTYEKACSFLGSKFFKRIDSDEIEIIRVMKVSNGEGSDDCSFTCKSQETGELFDINANELIDTCSLLTADGVISFAIVKMKTGPHKSYDDVIVSAYTINDLANAQASLVCRQNSVDFMYNIIGGPQDHDYVGVCATRADVPKNMNFGILTACDEVERIKMLNFYINDTLDSILEVLGDREINKINKVLETGFQNYLNKIKGIDVGQKHTKGQCRKVKTLLEINNFMYQLDTIYQILPLNIDIKSHLVPGESGGIQYEQFDKEMLEELGYLYQKKLSKVVVVQYDHDIDGSKLADSILKLRDKDGVLWLCNIVSEGEYLKNDLDLEKLASYTNDINIIAKYNKKV